MNKNKRELLAPPLSNKIPKMLPGRVKRRLFLGGLIIGMSAVTLWGGEFFLRQNPITLADIANQKKPYVLPPGQARLNLVLILDGLLVSFVLACNF